MPEYKIIGQRTLITAWTYLVQAKNKKEAMEKVEFNPDGMGDSDLERLQDDNVYEDNTTFTFLPDDIKVKSKPKKITPKKKK